MYPALRLLKVMRNAKKREKISYTDRTVISFRCHPWDLDMFNEMNNGRVLTLYDLGRMDLSVRCDLFSTLMNHKWALVVAGSSVRYRKRIKMFDEIEMHTQCVGSDDRWFYLEQSMWVNGEPCSSVLIRSGITSRKGLVSPDEVAQALGEKLDDSPLPLWVGEWVDSEQHRPWPPGNGQNEVVAGSTCT